MVYYDLMSIYDIQTREEVMKILTTSYSLITFSALPFFLLQHFSLCSMAEHTESCREQASEGAQQIARLWENDQQRAEVIERVKKANKELIRRATESLEESIKSREESEILFEKMQKIHVLYMSCVTLVKEDKLKELDAMLTTIPEEQFQHIIRIAEKYGNDKLYEIGIKVGTQRAAVKTMAEPI